MSDKMKILIIGHHKNDNTIYPHLRSIMNGLSKYCDVDYFYFRLKTKNVSGISNFHQFFKKTYCHMLLDTVYDSLGLFRIRLTRKYDYIIAIDDCAYIFTNFFFFKSKIIFWSFDYISYDNPNYGKTLVKKINNLVLNFLFKNKMIIIQDSCRLQAFLTSIGFENGDKQSFLKIFYLPVTLENISYVPHKMIGPYKKPRLLQYGSLDSVRYTDQLIDHYQKNYNQYDLFLHGVISRRIVALVEKCKILPSISRILLSPDKIFQVINNCDIGFIGYQQNDLNHKFISNASNQLVQFLRQGIPVIVLGDNDLQSFVNKHNTGCPINTIDELPGALNLIKSDYLHYSENARKCYESFFCTERFEKSLTEWLKSNLKSGKTYV